MVCIFQQPSQVCEHNMPQSRQLSPVETHEEGTDRCWRCHPRPTKQGRRRLNNQGPKLLFKLHTAPEAATPRNQERFQKPIAVIGTNGTLEDGGSGVDDRPPALSLTHTPSNLLVPCPPTPCWHVSPAAPPACLGPFPSIESARNQTKKKVIQRKRHISQTIFRPTTRSRKQERDNANASKLGQSRSRFRAPARANTRGETNIGGWVGGWATWATFVFFCLYLESPFDGVLRAARDLSRNSGPLLAQAGLGVHHPQTKKRAQAQI